MEFCLCIRTNILQVHLFSCHSRIFVHFLLCLHSTFSILSFNILSTLSNWSNWVEPTLCTVINGTCDNLFRNWSFLQNHLFHIVKYSERGARNKCPCNLNHNVGLHKISRNSSAKYLTKSTFLNEWRQHLVHYSLSTGGYSKIISLYQTDKVVKKKCQNLYSQKYPIRRIPSISMIKPLRQKVIRH